MKGTRIRKQSLLTRSLLVLLMLWPLVASMALADVLVTREGEQLETKGPWEVRGRMVVFTTPTGQLSSMRLDEIDLDASREATDLANRPPEAASPPPAAAAEAVMVLTDDDVARGVPAEGDDLLLLAERVRAAFAANDVGRVMSEVFIGEAQSAAGDALRSEVEGVLARPIADVAVNAGAATAVETEPQVVDGLTYAVPLPVIGRLEVELTLAEPEEGEPEITTFTFPVGNWLGRYQLLVRSPGSL
ncbi:MAG: hypothetical protein AAGD38_03530 [Acidobacteriota bacterium]